MNVILKLNHYKYFPYEMLLAEREVNSLLHPKTIQRTVDGLSIECNTSQKSLQQLVYFRAAHVGNKMFETLQSQLERSCATNGNAKRQSTRYSVHGFHEYRGKFNPQVVRGVLHILGVQGKARILDPFCGSGTSLVECSHVNFKAIGCDINPLAIFVSNAKLQSLRTPVALLKEEFTKICSEFELLDQSRKTLESLDLATSPRLIYLKGWFDKNVLANLENLRLIIEKQSPLNSCVFMGLVSDLLRDYSLQEPSDLRIRRRISPFPAIPFWVAYKEKVRLFLSNLEATQKVIGYEKNTCRAVLADAKKLTHKALSLRRNQLFDAVITSPPYAMALPYIDTQRLSLVWLNLIPPTAIAEIEASLTGSREYMSQQRREADQAMLTNSRELCESAYTFCYKLRSSIKMSDGFRRQNMPSLLYRYLCDMRDTFQRTLHLTRSSGYFALIVGHNKTTLGGTQIDINTPDLLRVVAESCGWHHSESVDLQTYQRYGLHAANSVAAETLLILQHP